MKEAVAALPPEETPHYIPEVCVCGSPIRIRSLKLIEGSTSETDLPLSVLGAVRDDLGRLPFRVDADRTAGSPVASLVLRETKGRREHDPVEPELTFRFEWLPRAASLNLFALGGSSIRRPRDASAPLSVDFHVELPFSMAGIDVSGTRLIWPLTN